MLERRVGQCRLLLEALVSAMQQLLHRGAAVSIASILAPPSLLPPPSDASIDQKQALHDVEAMHAELGKLREMLVDVVAQRVGDDCVANASECAHQ